MKLKTGVLVALYLVAVVAANLIVNHYGPSSTPYVAFGLVGGALILRDQFATTVGARRVIAQAALIGAGALLTWLINSDARQIVLASVVAFAASEGIEAVLYFAMRSRPWLERAPASATAGALVDSILFITIAFGFDFRVAFLQFVAKVAGGYLWAVVLGRWVRATPEELDARAERVAPLRRRMQGDDAVLPRNA